MHVEFTLVVNWNDAIELLLIEERFFRPYTIVLVLFKEVLDTKIGYNRSSDLEGMLLILSQMIRYSRLFAVKIGTTKFFVCNSFTSGCLDKRRAT